MMKLRETSTLATSSFTPISVSANRAQTRTTSIDAELTRSDVNREINALAEGAEAAKAAEAAAKVEGREAAASRHSGASVSVSREAELSCVTSGRW